MKSSVERNCWFFIACQKLIPGDNSILMNKEKKIIFLGFIMIPLSLISMFFWDQNIALILDSEIGLRLDKAANMVTWLGLADVYFWICSFGYIAAVVSEKYFERRVSLHTSQKFKKYFRLMFSGFVTSGLLTMILKMSFGRCRPYNSPVFDALYFKPFTLNWDFHSYPSGHTQVSFTLASFLAYVWPKMTIYFYILAGIIALSRVILDYHFLGDVIFGAYIGILGFYLAKKYSRINI
jgi:membrane-associated phospholipid phosphatase